MKAAIAIFVGLTAFVFWMCFWMWWGTTPGGPLWHIPAAIAIGIILPLAIAFGTSAHILKRKEKTP